MTTIRHINAGPGGPVQDVSGLHYQPGFLTPEQQAQAVRMVDLAEHEWRHDIRRRTQHHGWRYDYRARAITPDMYLGQLPDWLQAIARRLRAELTDPLGQPVFQKDPEQVIVNEYVGAQGIAPHIDHLGFGPAICTISLLEGWEMDLSLRRGQNQPALLEPGSCLTMTGESRYRWFHGIQARAAEPGGQRRGRRLSLTFRTVLNQDGQND